MLKYNETLYNAIYDQVCIIVGDQTRANREDDFLTNHYRVLYNPVISYVLDLCDWEFATACEPLTKLDSGNYRIPKGYIRFLNLGSKTVKCCDCSCNKTNAIDRTMFYFSISEGELCPTESKCFYFDSHTHIYYISSDFKTELVKGQFIELCVSKIVIALAAQKAIPEILINHHVKNIENLKKEIVPRVKSEFANNRNFNAFTKCKTNSFGNAVTNRGL